MSSRKLIRMPDSFRPRQYQVDYLDTVTDLLASAPDTPHLFSSPTSTGKSSMQLMTMQKIPDCVLITPRLEIINGHMEKLGHFTEDWNTEELVSRAWEYGITTPIRLRSMLAKGTLPFLPSLLISDECHHSPSDSWQDIKMYLNGCPNIGLTATPFRGTPKGTQDFLTEWNDTINQVLSLRQAVEQGYYQMPTPVLWPMIDDDMVEVVGGEFKVTSLNAMVCDRIKAVVERLSGFYCRKSQLWDMPTMVALPSTICVLAFAEECTKQGLPNVCVTQSTSREARKTAFRKTVDQSRILLQIDVVSEGVDLPIQRIVDLKSTMSPVRWMQQVGRIRPSTITQPEYICCNRNLERHGYLMEGLLPSSTFAEAQSAFSTPSKRGGSRGVGLEGLGKFKSIPMQLLNGITVQCYNLVSVNNFQKQEFFVIVHPAYQETIQGVRSLPIVDGKVDYTARNPWRLIDTIPDMTGFGSAKPYPLSEKQEKRWNQDAEKVGLNPHIKPDARSIQVFFFLRDTGTRFSNH